jgi:hypothetical protein
MHYGLVFHFPRIIVAGWSIVGIAYDSGVSKSSSLWSFILRVILWVVRLLTVRHMLIE